MMSGKTGARETAKKPSSTRRHDSEADGAFGRENAEQTRSPEEMNRKISGEPSKQHSKARKKNDG